MPSIDSASAQREVEIRFGECVTADQRPFAEQSITAMIERHSERVARRRAENREHAELMRAIHAPLLKSIEQDEDASAALRVLRAKRQPDYSGGDGVVHRPVRDSSSPGLIELRGFELIGLPYHYDWHWHNGDGELRPHMETDRIAGTAKVASDVIGSGTWVTGHAGIGVALTTDHLAAAAARPARTTWDSYRVAGAPIGGNATSEGGTEVTVFEDGNLVASGTDKHWHERASNGELKFHNTDGFGINDPIEVMWIMRPDHTYTLNVGAWTYCEYHNGLFSQSEAHATVDAKVLFIGLDR